MSISIETTQHELIANFNFYDNWLDKYQLLIDLGKKLSDFPEEFKIDANKIKGCQSNVWVTYSHNPATQTIQFTAFSDSSIVNGLIYLLLEIYNNRTPSEIINSNPHFISDIGLDHHLSPTRKNGLYSLLQAIRNIAVKHATG